MLDRTAVHPESYGVVQRAVTALGRRMEELRSAPGRQAVARAARANGALADELGVGARALEQILQALERAERDAREELPGPLLVDGSVRSLEQLAVGMQLAGAVRNVTPFGCFVNVGLKDDGLLHVSELRRRAVGLDTMHVGQRVDVVVMSVDVGRRRLSLGLAGSDVDARQERNPKRPRDS